MQAVMETIFDIVYLSTVMYVGINMVTKGRKNKEFFLFGIMAIVLGSGDAFHLVPRAYALCTTGLDNFVVALGIGKAVTSITMTVFYVILYYVWRIRYKVEDRNYLTVSMYVLAILRIALCLFPQNMWTSANAPLSWAIYRNIPFALMGLLVIYLFYTEAKKNNDSAFKYMWLTIVLSFAFYVPVVLWADTVPVVGVLMIPKTCAYVWSILIGYSEMKRRIKVEAIN